MSTDWLSRKEQCSAEEAFTAGKNEEDEMRSGSECVFRRLVEKRSCGIRVSECVLIWVHECSWVGDVAPRVQGSL